MIMRTERAKFKNTSNRIKKITFFVLALTILGAGSVLYADRTEVYIFNNTDTKFRARTSQYNDPSDNSPYHPLEADEWKSVNSSIDAYENDLQIYEINRNVGIHDEGGLYFYMRTQISPLGSEGEWVELQLRLKARGWFSSFAWLSLGGYARFAGYFNDPNWYEFDSKYTLHSQIVTLMGKEYKISYRNAGNTWDVYDDVYVIIENTIEGTADPEGNPVGVPIHMLESPQYFSVLAYNVMQLSLGGNETRAKLIPSLIASGDRGYDAIVLSEAFDDLCRDEIMTQGFAEAGYDYHTDVVEESAVYGDGGVIIFSRWPIVTWRDHVFQMRGFGVDYLADKGVMYAKINKNGRIFNLFGTHPQSKHTEAGMYVRSLQMKEMDDFIQSCCSTGCANEAVIIAGDFNIDRLTDWNEADEYRRIFFGLFSAQEPEYRGYSYTWDSFRNGQADGDGLAWLDYVMVLRPRPGSDPWRAIPRIAINTCFIPRLTAEQQAEYNINLDLSDHYPVWGFFEWQTD